MAMNYYSFVQRFADMSGTLKSDINPTIMVPSAIDYAEERLYRELNLITAQVTDTSASLSSDNRTFVLPNTIGTFVSVQELNVLTPSSLAGSSVGAIRNKCAPMALNWLNYVYPSEKSSFYGSTAVNISVPSVFANKDDLTMIVGPSPDAPFHVEVIGTIRPAQLTSTNSSTFLTKIYPDLFLAATMVFACGYIRDKALNTPNSGDIGTASQYWETQYQTLYRSAIAEDVRVKYNQTMPALYGPQPTTGGPA
jgi:hypothetical protein